MRTAGAPDFWWNDFLNDESQPGDESSEQPTLNRCGQTFCKQKIISLNLQTLEKKLIIITKSDKFIIDFKSLKIF
jgi:hypothetical protein